MNTIEITNYTASSEAQSAQIAPTQYVAINGQYDPMNVQSSYHAKAESIYFLLSIIQQQPESPAFEIPALDTLWYTEEGVKFEDMSKEEWTWKMMLPLPMEITPSIFEKAKTQALNIQPNNLFLKDFELTLLEENEVVQILHIGLYETIPESVEKIHAYMEQHNLAQAGVHHDIYLNNPQEVEVTALETIIRIPVQKK